MKKLLSVLLLTLLVGCSVQPRVEETVEITHKLGTTKVPTNPEKVVVFDMGIIDIMDALNLKVGAVAKDSLPEDLAKHNVDSVINAGTLFEPDYEGLASYKPDLIIISGRTAKQYDELSKIAPTVYMGRDTTDALITSMDANVAMLQSIYTKTKFNDIMTPLKTKIAELKALNEASGLSTLFLMANGNEIKAFGPNSRYDHVFNEFGFNPVTTDIEASTHGMTLSFEQVSALAPEVMLVMDRAAVTDGAVLAEALLDNDFIKNTPAGQNGKIKYVDPQHWYITEGGYQALQAMVDELLSLHR